MKLCKLMISNHIPIPGTHFSSSGPKYLKFIIFCLQFSCPLIYLVFFYQFVDSMDDFIVGDSDEEQSLDEPSLGKIL